VGLIYQIETSAKTPSLIQNSSADRTASMPSTYHLPSVGISASS